MKKLISLSILVFIAFGPIKAQRVSPYQSGSYYPGLINLRDLATAPAGIILLDYNYWYGSSDYYDKDGNVPVLFYASKFKVLGGARYLASINPVYMSPDYSVFLALGDTSGNITGSRQRFKNRFWSLSLVIIPGILSEDNTE